MTISHYVPESAEGETCHKCRKNPAKHKVGEVMPDGLGITLKEISEKLDGLNHELRAIKVRLSDMQN